MSSCSLLSPEHLTSLRDFFFLREPSSSAGSLGHVTEPFLPLSRTGGGLSGRGDGAGSRAGRGGAARCRGQLGACARARLCTRHVCAHVCVCAYVRMLTRLRVYMCACMHVCMCAICVCACMCARVCVRVGEGAGSGQVGTRFGVASQAAPERAGSSGICSARHPGHSHVRRSALRVLQSVFAPDAQRWRQCPHCSVGSCSETPRSSPRGVTGLAGCPWAWP